MKFAHSLNENLMAPFMEARMRKQKNKFGIKKVVPFQRGTVQST